MSNIEYIQIQISNNLTSDRRISPFYVNSLVAQLNISDSDIDSLLDWIESQKIILDKSTPNPLEKDNLESSEEDSSDFESLSLGNTFNSDNSEKDEIDNEDDIDSLIQGIVDEGVKFFEIETSKNEKKSSIDLMKADHLFSYYYQISLYKKLTQKEEYELGIRIQNGDQEALTELINHNLKLVPYVAKKYVYSSLELLDLIQEGNLGLIKAAQRFNPTLKIKFSTYAIWWIRQAITRAIYDKSLLIRLPVHINEKISYINWKESKFIQENGCLPNCNELYDLVKDRFSYDEFLKCLNVRIKFISLDTELIDVDKEFYNGRIDEEILNCDPYEEGAAPSFLIDDDDKNDLLISGFIPGDSNPALFAQEKLNREVLYKILKNTLKDREFSIICDRFGLFGVGEKTLEEVGRKFKLTRERIRQIEAKAIKKLRSPKNLALLKALY